MNAHEITKAHGGDWCGKYGLIPGPGHSSQDRSLQVRDGDRGGLIVHSFAGDDWRVCRDYLKALGFIAGRDKKQSPYYPPQPSPEDDLKNIMYALNIWQNRRPATGTIVETYLQSRSLSLPPLAPIAFHPACPRAKERLPAMIALMTDIMTNEPRGIHRTFLKSDGSGKVDSGKQKMMLGPAKGAVVRLDAEVRYGLGIAEGIESALSVMQSGWRPVWAALSDNGIRDFPLLAGIQSLTIFSDNDENYAGIKAARACALRWSAAGKEVTIRQPLKIGDDWNDVIREVQNVR